MRLFVGLPLPEDIRAVLGSMCNGLDGARWVKPESMHLTLRFVGEVGGADAADLDMALNDVRASAFEMQCRDLGHFGKAGKVRALWAGVPENAGLNQLQDKVERAVAGAGYGSEGRKFKPHVTLARFRGRVPRGLGDYLNARGAFSSALFSVSSFTLFESRMGHGGSHYVPLNDYPLYS